MLEERRPGASNKAYRVIVHCVDTVGQDLVEELPFHCKGVAVQPQDMMGIHLPDCGFEAVIKCWQAVVFRVTGLVDGVEASYPSVILVSSSDLLPQPDCAVLVIFIFPEHGMTCRIVRVPVWILRAWHGMHVQDCVYFLLRALGVLVSAREAQIRRGSSLPGQ